MTDELLVFDGVRWPRARITGSRPVIRKFFDEQGRETPPERPPLVFGLAPEGNGKRYRARGPAGWWRDLVTMDQSDPQAVLTFLARRGDPAGLLEQAALNLARQQLGQPLVEMKFQPDTGEWFGLNVALGSLSRAWGPPDAEGISRIDPVRWNDSEILWRTHFAADWLGEIELAPDPDRRRPLILRAKTLSAYLVLSAASSLYRRAQMRTCARCGSWFEFIRGHALFCSMSCRSMAHASRGA